MSFENFGQYQSSEAGMYQKREAALMVWLTFIDDNSGQMDKVLVHPAGVATVMGLWKHYGWRLFAYHYDVPDLLWLSDDRAAEILEAI